MCNFWPLLMWATIYGAAQSLPDIGSSIKPNYHSQVKLVQIPDTCSIYERGGVKLSSRTAFIIRIVCCLLASKMRKGMNLRLLFLEEILSFTWLWRVSIELPEISKKEILVLQKKSFSFCKYIEINYKIYN